jgi:hypothetical protein
MLPVGPVEPQLTAPLGSAQKLIKHLTAMQDAQQWCAFRIPCQTGQVITAKESTTLRHTAAAETQHGAPCAAVRQ